MGIFVRAVPSILSSADFTGGMLHRDTKSERIIHGAQARAYSRRE